MEVFEWDAEKEKTNIKKHGMSLEAGMLVFKDYYRLESYDKNNSAADEDRYITIGFNETTNILYVVYTTRDHSTIRLISVRRADPAEKRQYRQNRGGK